MALNLGSSIRQIRQALNETQRDFSSRIGVNQSTLSQYEGGGARPSLPVLLRILNSAPSRELREAVHNYLAQYLESTEPGSEYPESTEGVIKSLASADLVLSTFPPTKSAARSAQLSRFAHLVPDIGRMPSLDSSVVDILEMWVYYGDSETVKIFRDAAKYLSVRIDVLAGGDPLEPSSIEDMRAAAQAARGLAVSLLHQADIAEEKARLYSVQQKPKPPRGARKDK